LHRAPTAGVGGTPPRRGEGQAASVIPSRYLENNIADDLGALEDLMGSAASSRTALPWTLTDSVRQRKLKNCCK
jgi:hypothetical protein